MTLIDHWEKKCSDADHCCGALGLGGACGSDFGDEAIDFW
jgi:hypothetical protein